MSWLEKLLPSKARGNATDKKTVPEGLWTKCPACNAVLYRAELERNLDVCPKCDHHMRTGARRRLEAFLDVLKRDPLQPGKLSLRWIAALAKWLRQLRHLRSC